MITLTEWQFSFILGLMLATVIVIIMTLFILKQYEKRELHKKHFCNHCKTAFLRIKDLDKTHCDYCGRPLTLHIEDPDFIEEKALERENNLQPFEEFNDKGGE